MKRLIQLKVNDEIYEVAVHPHRTLLEVLREELDLTGTKRACNVGDCGSCTVILEGKPVVSCLTLAVEADRKDILTVEGLAQDGEMHPLQKSFVERGAVQCGFCTPGMLMSAKALLDENPNSVEDEVRTAIAGNLCRCTGYVKIVEAILAVSQQGG
ncbi:MAG: (2Fe-2S)-binding protein [Nitrospira bacterium SG8_3]|nr:MAG: (2Fe-2S)-binding protein [Nitrospira bacterium SG8_3]